MEPITITVQERKDCGKSAAASLRRSGLVPANIYTQGKESVLISIAPEVLMKALEDPHKRNTLLKLQLGDVSYTVLLKEAQRDPVKGKLLHVDFYQVEDGQYIERSIPLELVGRAAGVQIGGQLRKFRRVMKVRALANELPVSIDLDVTTMKVGDSRRVSDLPKIENLTYLERDNVILAQIESTRAVVAGEGSEG